MSEQAHKWLPSEPTINILISLATRISHIHLKKMKDQSFDIVPDIRELYAFLYASLPDVEQEPVAEVCDRKTDKRYETYVHCWEDLPVRTKLYTHPQPKD
jgi:hypothetical protein